MSYLNQNYFNNFQVRNPILKNPINRNPPLQLSKIRPAELTGSNGASIQITTENVQCGALRVLPTAAVNGIYILPTASELIDLMGVQNNGLPTPSFTNSLQQGDVLILPVINNTQGTGCLIYAKGGTSTGTVTISPVDVGLSGEVNQLVIDFKNVTQTSYGVTGAYNIYKQA